jgi:hypothetical protein
VALYLMPNGKIAGHDGVPVDLSQEEFDACCCPGVWCRLVLNYACVDTECGDCWFSSGEAGDYHWEEVEREAECITQAEYETREEDGYKEGWHSEEDESTAFYVAYFFHEVPDGKCPEDEDLCEYLYEKETEGEHEGEYKVLPSYILLDTALHPESRPPPDGDLNECPAEPEPTKGQYLYDYEGYDGLGNTNWKRQITGELEFTGISGGKAVFTGTCTDKTKSWQRGTPEPDWTVSTVSQTVRYNCTTNLWEGCVDASVDTCTGPAMGFWVHHTLDSSCSSSCNGFVYSVNDRYEACKDAACTVECTVYSMFGSFNVGVTSFAIGG